MVCARACGGDFYAFAEANGVTKIALGHHRDDGRNTVIQPLAYCREKGLERFAELRGYPVIPCNLCGVQENL